MANPNFLEQPVMTHEVHIRRGVLINTDPQHRCYDGVHFSSHMEWGEWKHWQDAPSESSAQTIARLLARADQQLRVVPKTPSTDVQLRARS